MVVAQRRITYYESFRQYIFTEVNSLRMLVCIERTSSGECIVKQIISFSQVIAARVRNRVHLCHDGFLTFGTEFFRGIRIHYEGTNHPVIF